ncbi:MAG: WD40/YVTN/BNR-like repeat-containing protein [Acidimicrobiales bacterium]
MSTEELLRRLGEVDPVDPQLLDTVVGDILAAARWPDLAPEPEERAPQLAAVIPIKAEPARHRGHRLGALARGRVMRATAVGSAALVAAVATLAGLGDLPTRNGPLPSHHVAGARPTSTGFQLVDASSSPFATVAAGSTDDNLQCVTQTACYANVYRSAPHAPSGVERTTDGGKTWKFVAGLPGGATLSDSVPLSCPTTQMCMGVATAPYPPKEQARLDAALKARASQVVPGKLITRTAKGRQVEANLTAVLRAIGMPPLELVVTTDGGANWTVDRVGGAASLPAPFENGSSLVKCTTAQVCTVYAGSGLFVTTDGGSTWTKEPPLPQGVARLLCDPDGTCIAVQSLGKVHSSSIVGLRSTNFGKTWTAGPPGPEGGAILNLDCADTTHCMSAYPVKGGIKVTHTANAGRSWQVSTVPTTSPYGPANDVTSISCANGTDCWLALSAGPVVQASGLRKVQIRAAAYIYRTQDGGATWTDLPLPSVNGSPLVIVYPMSCPSTLGCIAVGATDAQFNPRHTPGTPLTTPGREILSDLPQA